MTELEKELKKKEEQRQNGSMEKDKRRAERDIRRLETGGNETENAKKAEGEVSRIIREGDGREIEKDKIENKRNDNRRRCKETEQKEGEREERERKEERGIDSTGKESISISHGETEMPKNNEVNNQEFSQLKELMFYQLSPFKLISYGCTSLSMFPYQNHHSLPHSFSPPLSFCVTVFSISNAYLQG